MDEPKTVISNINDAYTYISDCDPFKIHRAVLTSPWQDDADVWVVGLRGTNGSFNRKDPLSMPVCFRSCCGKDNIFFSLVKNAIKEQIPAGAKVVFIGHSLGGMVCQQLGADKELKNTYKLLNVLTFGSPYVIFKGKKCPLTRMAERADFIPHTCSVALLGNCFFGNIKHESGGYYFKFPGAHCDSYQFSPVWRKYDCFGTENGGRTLIIK